MSPPETTGNTSAKEVTNDRDGGAANGRHANGEHTESTVRDACIFETGTHVWPSIRAKLTVSRKS